MIIINGNTIDFSNVYVGNRKVFMITVGNKEVLGQALWHTVVTDFDSTASPTYYAGDDLQTSTPFRAHYIDPLTGYTLSDISANGQDPITFTFEGQNSYMISITIVKTTYGGLPTICTTVSNVIAPEVPVYIEGEVEIFSLITGRII